MAENSPKRLDKCLDLDLATSTETRLCITGIGVEGKTTETCTAHDKNDYNAIVLQTPQLKTYRDKLRTSIPHSLLCRPVLRK
jgi:hypothetical protein